MRQALFRRGHLEAVHLDATRAQRRDEVAAEQPSRPEDDDAAQREPAARWS